MLTIPPHTSHRLQPLDRCVYGPFKTAYNMATDAWLRSNPGKTVTIYDIPELVKQAQNSAMTPTNIVSGFESTGIFPYNRDLFTDVDFAPAAITTVRHQKLLKLPTGLRHRTISHMNRSLVQHQFTIQHQSMIQHQSRVWHQCTIQCQSLTQHLSHQVPLSRKTWTCMSRHRKFTNSQRRVRERRHTQGGRAKL